MYCRQINNHIMRETCEFRIAERYANKLFAPNDGKKMGDSVRKMELATSDPRFHKVGEFQAEIRAATGQPFFYGWRMRRYYTKNDYKKAQLYFLKIPCVFEPAGEECGTVYDESSACPKCGAGAKQTSKLCLDWRRLPSRRDIAKTIGGELIVSRRFVEITRRYEINGARFLPICYRPKSSAESKDWFQLVVDSALADITPPTQTGVDPFDKDSRGKYRCDCGDLIGLNLLSEVWINSVDLAESDFVASKQFIGIRRGLLRPERLILVSPKFWHLMNGKERLIGVDIEVAHFHNSSFQLAD